MPDLAADLARLLDEIERPGDFSVGGLCDLLAPHLEIEGVGTIALPLLPVQAEQIVAVADRAPFGRGEQTLVDMNVRRTWQIGTDQISIEGTGWARTLAGIVGRAAEGLGVVGSVTAEFYKLLIYEAGGFFAGHRDSEKVPGMFATLVIVLPSPNSGGKLVVRHAGQEVCYDMHPPEPSQAAFAAFYADCLHEVLPVMTGWRLTLVYNLVRAAPGGALQAPDHGPERSALTERLRRWDEDAPAKLVIPLSHAYTPASLSFASLKGMDAAKAAVLAAAAASANCDLHLALLTIEESGSAEEIGGWGYGRRGRSDEENGFEVVEVQDREEILSDWQRPDGTTASLGPLPVEDGEVAPADALDDLAPDHQSLREATGNEGASFERTYRRVALVIWPRADRLAIVNQGGLAATLPLLAEYAERWVAEGSGDRASPAWSDAHNLSGHMLASWSPGHRGYGPASDKAIALLASLCRLRDGERIEQALRRTVAEGFYFKGQAPEVLASLRLLPEERIGPILEALVAGNAGIAFPDAADLLNAAAASGGIDIGSDALRPAASALLSAMPGSSMATSEPGRGGLRKVGPGAAADSLAAFESIDPALAREAVDTMLAHPALYGLDDAVIPALLKLGREGASSARERLQSVGLAHLERRIAEPLVPPADWRRDATLKCNCRLCADLGHFLADPGRDVWTLKASEHERSHVEDTVRNSGSDLNCETLKKGRPYTLVCTKTDTSYRRRVEQRERDLSSRARLCSN